MTPDVRAMGARVLVTLPDEPLHGLLVELARTLDDDGEQGTVRTALDDLSTAHLITSTSQDTREAWLTPEQIADADADQAEALDALTYAVGPLTWSLDRVAARALVAALTAALDDGAAPAWCAA